MCEPNSTLDLLAIGSCLCACVGPDNILALSSSLVDSLPLLCLPAFVSACIRQCWAWLNRRKSAMLWQTSDDGDETRS